VGGHWYRWGTRKDVADSYEFVSDIWTETGKALAAIPITPFFGKVEAGNSWAAVDLWYDAVADAAEPVILNKWVNRLGAPARVASAASSARYRSRKPPRNRRKKPPSWGSGGAGGGAVVRCRATGWS
jgi:hypothetical protein